MALNIAPTLRNALRRLEAEKASLDRQIAAIHMALGSAGRTASRIRRRKPMSAAARAAVSRRMKAFWAKQRAAKKK